MHKAGRNRRLRKTHQAEALRVRAFDRDLRRANGIMASGIWKGRMTGRTHGRSDQPCAEAPENPCQRRAVHTRPDAEIEVVAPDEAFRPIPSSDVYLLGDREGVIDLDAKIAHGAFHRV